MRPAGLREAKKTCKPAEMPIRAPLPPQALGAALATPRTPRPRGPRPASRASTAPRWGCGQQRSDRLYEMESELSFQDEKFTACTVPFLAAQGAGHGRGLAALRLRCAGRADADAPRMHA